MSALAAVVARELRLAGRSRADVVQPLMFYALVATIFPLGVAPNSPWLQSFAPALLWVGALLAALLAFERTFRGDFEDGTLEQMFLGASPPSLLVFGKLLGSWIVTGVPLVLLAPVLGLMLGLKAAVLGVLTLGLLLGTPAIFFIGGFSGALTVGLPRAGVLLPILVLPMASPIVIFGAGAVRAAAVGAPFEAPLYFLAAILVLCLCLVPLATAAALRNSFD